MKIINIIGLIFTSFVLFAYCHPYEIGYDILKVNFTLILLLIFLNLIHQDY